ncbi:MAG: NAD-dependent dehydratase, partial [Alphaproteobacteria bacterium]
QEAVTIRPPLVYGPAVRGNLRALARLVRTALPLPFAGLGARRSLVGVTNLTGAVELCLRHPDAAGGRYLVADWHPTTADLAAALAAADGRAVRLWPVPSAAFRMAAALGAGAAIARLTEALEVDAGGLSRLGWRPEVAPADELVRLMRAL